MTVIIFRCLRCRIYFAVF